MFIKKVTAIQRMVTGLLTTIQTYLYNIVVGIVILLIGLGLGILAKKLVSRVLREIELNKIMMRIGIMTDIEKALSNMVAYLIYLISIVFFLNQLGITSIVLYLVVGAVLMLLVLTFIVGLKDVFPNLVGWLYLQKKHHKIKEGYHININEITGRVQHIGYLETEIKTDNGDVLYIPNALFLKSKFRLRQ